MENKPLVSVIIPTFNRQDFLLEALQSVVSQSYRPLQIIVVDDGSTDNTKLLLEEWNSSINCEDQIEVIIENQKNQGAPRARNLGISKAKGSFIQFLDSDDLLHKDKIEIQVSYLNNNSNKDFVYSLANIFYQEIGDSDSISGSNISMTLSGHIGAHALKTDLGLYRTELIKKIGLWNENLKVWQEREYNLRLFVIDAKIGFIPKVLAYYRIHDGERISKNLTEQRHLDSLSYLEKTASRLCKKDNKIASDKICSHYFSIYIHSIKERKYTIAFKAARQSLWPAIKSKKITKILKSIFLNIFYKVVPRQYQASVGTRLINYSLRK